MLAAISALIWGRFILMLQLTKTFGPILRIIIVMIGDVLKFLFIWTVVLICLASIASLLFGELPEFDSFLNVILTMFSTGLGNYDYSIFNDLKLGAIWGQSFIVFAVLVNGIVLLNFIIAILADTYSKLSSQSLGIYYDGIIAKIPVYEHDATYGGLIVGIPPFNVLALLMVPVYALVKDEARLRSINHTFEQVLYVPLGLFLTIVFVALSTALVPFAYL